MANHRSAVKRHKQSEIKRVRNTTCKSAIKTAVKKVRESVSSGNEGAAKENLLSAVVLLDRAVTKGALSRNNASRRISRLTTHVNSISAK